MTSSSLVLAASWVTVALTEEQFQTCQSVLRNVEGDFENYFCNPGMQCCPTEENPTKCCLSEMEQETISLKMLILYGLLILISLLLIILLIYGFCRLIKKKRSSSQDKEELEMPAEPVNKLRSQQPPSKSRRFDNYGDDMEPGVLVMEKGSQVYLLPVYASVRPEAAAGVSATRSRENTVTQRPSL